MVKKIVAIAPALGLLLVASPALAWSFPSHTTTVTNLSSAVVMNSVSTSASTGGNVANGGNGGNALGKKANGGMGGNGGAVLTGNATTLVGVGNTVNTNGTVVDSCGCTPFSSSAVVVTNASNASVGNTVNTSASTGGNVANGGNGGSAVGGFWFFGAANGGDAGNGGLIATGNAGAQVEVVNVVNSNVTEIN